MATSALSQPKRRLPKPDDAGTRALNAMLRWRLHLTLSRVTPDAGNALRFLPALLQASFASPPLRGEAPGITRLKFRRRWSVLARIFGLPPPTSMQRGKAAIEALLLVPRGEGLDIIALCTNELPAPMRQRVLERCAAAKTALGPAGRNLEIKLLDLNSVDEALFQSILSLGSLLAGAPPAIFYSATHTQTPVALPIPALLAERAPTPMAALALMVMVGGPGPSPLAVARDAMGDQISAQTLADPSFFCARWAALATAREELLMDALRWSRAKPLPQGAVESAAAGEILRKGRELALLCARAIHRLPLSASRALRIRLLRDVVGPGLPRALLPALAQCKLKFSATPVAVGKHFEVRLGDGAGTVLGRGRTSVQARVRATALAAAAGATPDSKLAARLSKPTAVETLHTIVETYEIPGPPFDPLNRGPGRQIGLLGGTALLLRLNGRPTGFQLSAEEVVMRVCNDALNGREIEVVPQMPEGQPAAARLARVIALVQKKGPLPAAIEAGGMVLIPRKDGSRIRRVSLNHFARRPITCATDPEAFDLALSPERGARNSGAFTIPGAVVCRVFQSDADAQLAYVLTQDDRGRLLREEVPLDRLEGHLREGQEILRGCTPPAPLASRLADGIEMLLLRHRRPLFALALGIGGALPFGLWAEISGERILLGKPGGWAAAAQSVLSWLPVGEEPRLRISRAEVTEGGEPACAISRLYVRSYVLRRLSMHLKRQLALIER